MQLAYICSQLLVWFTSGRHAACIMCWLCCSLHDSMRCSCRFGGVLHDCVPCSCRFGGLLHDWPINYFKAQQSNGNALAGIFKQAMSQNQAQKISRSRSIISRMFSGGSALARLKSLTVRTDAGHLTCLLPVLHLHCRQKSPVCASGQWNTQQYADLGTNCAVIGKSYPATCLDMHALPHKAVVCRLLLAVAYGHSSTAALGDSRYDR